LRWTITIFTTKEIAELQGGFDKLQIMWPRQKAWELKEASLTPKSHHLWFEVTAQLPYLDWLFHLLEDPIEKFYKLDKLTDMVHYHTQKY
jgi:hypothetical protein